MTNAVTNLVCGGARAAARPDPHPILYLVSSPPSFHLRAPSYSSLASCLYHAAAARHHRTGEREAALPRMQRSMLTLTLVHHALHHHYALAPAHAIHATPNPNLAIPFLTTYLVAYAWCVFPPSSPPLPHLQPLHFPASPLSRREILSIAMIVFSILLVLLLLVPLLLPLLLLSMSYYYELLSSRPSDPRILYH
ncbi:hypothetical protein GY45DRAFT_1104069 [Cubamyces sp. BRFM 1775]|nr:hypothetical protein GY45DRAFT_1104069 [Cubamyces sp. BRFM 1775]